MPINRIGYRSLRATYPSSLSANAALNTLSKVESTGGNWLVQATLDMSRGFRMGRVEGSRVAHKALRRFQACLIKRLLILDQPVVCIRAFHWSHSKHSRAYYCSGIRECGDSTRHFDRHNEKREKYIPCLKIYKKNTKLNYNIRMINFLVCYRLSIGTDVTRYGFSFAL